MHLSCHNDIHHNECKVDSGINQPKYFSSQFQNPHTAFGIVPIQDTLKKEDQGVSCGTGAYHILNTALSTAVIQHDEAVYAEDSKADPLPYPLEPSP